MSQSVECVVLEYWRTAPPRGRAETRCNPLAVSGAGTIALVEATALGSAAMFAGVLVLPAVFSLITAATGDYLIAYSGLAALAFISALSLALSKPS